MFAFFMVLNSAMMLVVVYMKLSYGELMPNDEVFVPLMSIGIFSCVAAFLSFYFGKRKKEEKSD